MIQDVPDRTEGPCFSINEAGEDVNPSQRGRDYGRERLATRHNHQPTVKPTPIWDDIWTSERPEGVSIS